MCEIEMYMCVGGCYKPRPGFDRVCLVLHNDGDYDTDFSI